MTIDSGTIPLRPSNKYREIVAVLFGCSLISILGWFQLGDPFIMDETEFASAIRAVVRTGKPGFYATELTGMKSGLWHPPTYVYYAAAWSTLLGHSWFIVRLATLTLTIFTVPVIGFLASVLSHQPNQSSPKSYHVVLVAVVLYSLSPLVIQNGVLVDINGSLLAVVSTLYVAWMVLTFGPRPISRIKKYAGIVCLVFLISWTKFGVLPVLLIATIIFSSATSGPKSGLAAGTAFLLGFFMFILSWWGASNLLGIPFVDPFIHNFGMVYSSTADTSIDYDLTHRILMRGWVLFNEVLWLSPFLIILAALSLRKGIPRRRTTRTFIKKLAANQRIFVAMIAFGFVAQYSVLAKMPYGFPKYMGTVTPLLASLAAFPVASIISRNAAEIPYREIGAIIGLICMVAVTVFLLPDPFIAPFEQGVVAVVQQATMTVLGGLLISILVLGILFSLSRWTAVEAVSTREVIVLTIVVLLVGTNIGILATQASADYSTRYFYGQPSMEDGIAAVNGEYNNLTQSERPHAALPMDLGYYVDGPHSDVDQVQSLQDRGIDPALVVVRTQHYYDAPTPIVEELRTSEQFQSYRSGWFLIFVQANNSKVKQINPTDIEHCSLG